MLRSEAERAAESKRRDDARKEHWATLIRSLRAANPTPTIAYDRSGGSMTHARVVVIDGAHVDIRLDEEIIGDGFYAKRGRFYFTIGSYRGRRNSPRPRAVCKKDGFDWARIAQLVEDERKRVARNEEANNIAEAREKATQDQLDALYKRRPGFRDNPFVTIEHGAFRVLIQGLDVERVERVLDAVLSP